ncbi:MAG: hypothetical protein ACWGPR_11565 [Candidatus Deferrimicrobiaceae bacterium]
MTKLPTKKRARKRSGKPKPAPPPSYKPWPAVILTADPGERCGWAMGVRGAYLGSGEVDRDDSAALERICRIAIETAAIQGLPAVLVLEYHPWQGRGSSRAGLERAREAWRIAWRRAGGQASKIVNANVSTWRSRVTGVTQPDDVARAAEQGHATLVARRPVGPEEAPAVGMLTWGSRAGEVGKVLPKRSRVAVGMEV